MYTRLLTLPANINQSLFLFGPRGTGKTSWLKSMFPQGLYFDLLDFSFYQTLSSHPNRLEKLIPAGFSDWVILDEVQRVPLLLNEVHRLIEHKQIKFLLIGSSARSLRRRGVNLLAGRALTYHMHPFVIQELKESFDLTRVLQYGLLPGVYLSDNPKKYLETYVQTYLREEVLQEGLTRSIDAFSRFLEIASFSQGSVLNYSEVARDAGINRQVVINYFSILEDLLLAASIPPFVKKAKRRLIRHSKFYFFDVGVYRLLRPKGPLDISEEIDGAALETLFLQTLRALNDYLELGFKIFYWRTSEGIEVDFVLYGEKGLFAFEIKRSSSITPKMFKGLNAFRKDYPMAKVYLVYGGDRMEYHDGVTVIPFLDALKQLPELLGVEKK